MATASPMGEDPSGAGTHVGEPASGTPVDERTSRLAELVTGLTGCPPTGALHVLRTDDEPVHDPLELVARAMVRVDAPPDPHLRIGGHLRDDGDDGRLGPRSARSTATAGAGTGAGEDGDRLRPPPWLSRGIDDAGR